MSRSAAWLAAYEQAQPVDSAQQALVDLLAEPIAAAATGRLARRRQRLLGLPDRITVEAAARIVRRLDDPSDPLARLVRLELATPTRARLHTAFRATAGRAPRGQRTRGLEDDGTAGRKLDERGVDDRKLDDGPKQPSPPGPPRPLRPGQPRPRGVPPGPDQPPRRRIRTTEPPPGRPPGMREVDKPPDGGEWVHRVLRGLGYGAGGVAAAGLFLVPAVVLEEALRQAFLTFVTGNVSQPWMVNKLIGNAGERAATVITRWSVERTSARLLDLNRLARDFPFADLITAGKPIDVKVHMVNSRLTPGGSPAAQAAWEKRVGSDYAQDLLRIWGDHPRAVQRRERAAATWLEHRRQIQALGVWPADLPPNPTAAQMAEFLRTRTVIAVPSDHVGIARNYIGQRVHAQYLRGELDWPEGLTTAQAARRVSAVAARVESIGISGRDLATLLDIAKRLPAVQRRITRDAQVLRWDARWGEPPPWGR